MEAFSSLPMHCSRRCLVFVSDVEFEFTEWSTRYRLNGRSIKYLRSSGYRLLQRPEHAWLLSYSNSPRVSATTTTFTSQSHFFHQHHKQSLIMLSKVLRNSTPSLRALRQVTPVARAFSSTSVPRREVEAIETPLSLWNFTEEENMLRETG